MPNAPLPGIVRLVSWRAVRVGAFVVLVFAFVGCGTGDATPSLSAGLVRAADLPGEWTPFTSGPRPKSDLCGEALAESKPLPVDSASTAWAVDPDDGPILGERIERFADAGAALSVLFEQLVVPCDFESADGSRWRTERLSPPAGVDSGRVFLVTSRDRPDSFNYEAAVIDGPVAILVSLNSRTENRDLLDEILATAVARAGDAGVAF